MTTLAEIDVVINAKLDPLMKSSKQAEKIIRDLDKRLNGISKKTIAPQVNVKTNTRQLDALIAKMNQLASRKVNPSVNVNTKPAQRNVDNLRSSVSGLASTVAAGFGVREITQFADAWTLAGNKIKSAAEGAGVQTRSLESLNEMAKETRSSLTATVDLYAKLINSSSTVAKSEQEIADATMIVTKAFKASGASTAEQTASIIQLGQALGSGVLQGDELRSIREQAPLIAKAIAKEFDTTVGGLKKLGEEGKLTSDRVFKAILAAGPQISAQFAKTNATIGDSFTLLKNSLTEYIGQMNETYGITETIGTVMASLAGNISSVANAAAAAAVVLLFPGAVAIAGALLSPWVLIAAAIGAAAYALTDFWDTIIPLQGSVATLGDYSVAMWDMIKEAANSASESFVSAFNSLNESITEALSGVGVSAADISEAFSFMVNNTIENFVRMKDIIVATFTMLPQAVAGGVIGAMNTMIGYVQAGLNTIIGEVNKTIQALNNLGNFAGVGSVLGEIGMVDLGQLENKFAGAGEQLGEAYGDAFTRTAKDYVGSAKEAINQTVDEIKTRANEVARTRAASRKDGDSGPQAPSQFGTGSTAGYGGFKPSGVGGGGGGKGKKGGGRSKKSDYEKEVQQIKDRTAALVAETEAQRNVNPLIDDYGFASTRAKAAQELLTAAQKSGIAAGKELKDVSQLLNGEFDGLSPAAREQAQAMLELATKYGEAEAASDSLKESQERTKQAMEDARELGKDVLGGFIKDLQSGKSASEALANALSKVADKLLDVGLNALFGTGQGSGASSSGLFGGLLGGLGKLFSFEGGGNTGSGSRAGGMDGKGGFLAMVHPNESIIDHEKGISVPKAQLKPTVGGNNGPSSVAVTMTVQTDSGQIIDIADARVKNAAPAIVRTSISEGQKQTKSNMPGYLANAQARQI